MTILSFFTLNNPIVQLCTNLYHKKDHFLKISPLLHYFSEIYLKIYDFALFLKKTFLPTQKKNMSLNKLIWSQKCKISYSQKAAECSHKIFPWLSSAIKQLLEKFNFELILALNFSCT